MLSTLGARQGETMQHTMRASLKGRRESGISNQRADLITMPRNIADY
jgi:hypothetical protein